ncbi:MAG: nucleotidyl transferase AbiEii/AbiGii toxin family protein [Gammaproteobacteria bacterium]|nr:nucleotidyl transferase AbiEii/AbiGii toxin family protein [Gammaproteobacteria bacterium]MDE0271602.1 nucleotidyl transferase AbiEii/AbiGii toxin family protein [Gammaproteobacteria bacterium]
MPSLDDGPALPLDGDPKSSLVRGLALLKRHMLPEEAENLRMGGGTVLAMRWGHRLSTDVDLVLDKEMHRQFVLRVRDDLRAELQGLRERREIKKYRISARFAGWEYPDSGPISLSASSAGRQCYGIEANTGIALASTEAILTGKLLGRVLVGGQLVARDGYDLCAAFHYDLKAARSVLSRARVAEPDELEAIYRRIEEAGKRLIVGRPLVDVSHPEWARDPWGTFVTLAREAETSRDLDGQSGPAPD